ncbi:hypothetical protein GOP47_0015757 [Adiantum capillus-veneris]|uniref:VASt domain-containing protein n=1 Tax=Adiantum capillus-veneris TaxID=13818 RepID=A0A9D4UKB2_ADICA|nr:hypothetical protein GOP47_0015757 [Adiantum capillus-veneris]
MVKHLEFRGVIGFASPEMVFKLLYEDDGFTKFYHKEVNEDENASATSWTNANGYRYRTVTFKPHFSNVPTSLQYILGGDLSPVTEIQECRSAENTFIIHSKLEVRLPGNVTAISSGDTILSPLGTRCEIVVKLTLELQTWYFQEWLENYAESVAMVAFKRWLKIARGFCKRMVGMKEERLPEEGDMNSGANDLPKENDLSFDATQLEEEETEPMFQNCREAPATSPCQTRTTRFWLIRVIWRQFCATFWRNYGKLMTAAKEVLLVRQSNFLLEAWTTFGLGIAAGVMSPSRSSAGDEAA